MHRSLKRQSACTKMVKADAGCPRTCYPFVLSRLHMHNMAVILRSAGRTAVDDVGLGSQQQSC